MEETKSLVDQDTSSEEFLFSKTGRTNTEPWDLHRERTITVNSICSETLTNFDTDQHNNQLVSIFELINITRVLPVASISPIEYVSRVIKQPHSKPPPLLIIFLPSYLILLTIYSVLCILNYQLNVSIKCNPKG